MGRTVLRARKIESDRYLIHRFYYTPRGDVARIEYPKGNTTVMEYDFLGYKIGQQSANQNDMSFMYDSAGRMRFRYIEDGGSNVVRYWKYDIYSRIVETGAVVHPFDEELKSHVNDPNWRNTPPTIAYSYDGLETEDPALLGRLHTSVAANQIPQSGQTDQWEIETEYGYDERGNKIRKGIAVRGELEASYELTFGYNGIDRLISSSVPDEGETLEIAYWRDPFDRVERLEVNGSPRLEYSYDNNSHLTGQRLLGNDWNAERTYTSTPFGWPKSVSGPGFSEDKEYFTGGYPDDRGYYTGRPAKIVTAARGGQPAYTRRMRYNPVGWLTDYEQQALPSRAQATLNQLLDRLETNLPPEQHRDRDYRVLFVPQKIVNALALPGDTIVIYQGLVAQAESENELMMVLRHELGHFANRDHLRGLGQALVLRLAIASIFGDVGGLQAVLVSGAEAFSRSQYSQSQELQADEFGIDLLQATYGHVAGATDFFARLDRKRGANIAFLSTHPAPGNRVAQLQRIIEERGYPVRERSPLPPSLQQIF